MRISAARIAELRETLSLAGYLTDKEAPELLDALEAANRQIERLVEVGHKYGWNGVDNSKILALFFDSALEVGRVRRAI